MLCGTMSKALQKHRWMASVSLSLLTDIDNIKCLEWDCLYPGLHLDLRLCLSMTVWGAADFSALSFLSLFFLLLLFGHVIAEQKIQLLFSLKQKPIGSLVLLLSLPCSQRGGSTQMRNLEGVFSRSSIQDPCVSRRWDIWHMGNRQRYNDMAK